jgi:hypothetical protein
MQLHVVRRVDSVETPLTSATIAGLSQTVGQGYRVACRAVTSGGSTQVAAKLWRSGASEPASWQLTSTDSTAGLQAAGGVGISAYNSSSATQPVTLSVDDVKAVTP